MKIMSSPIVAMFFFCPELKPSPTPIRNSSDPTPQAMPNMVKNDRSLCAHSMLNTCPIVSKAILIDGLPLAFYFDRQLTRMNPALWREFPEFPGFSLGARGPSFSDPVRFRGPRQALFWLAGVGFRRLRRSRAIPIAGV